MTPQSAKNQSLSSFLKHDYFITGKVTGLFIEEFGETCMFCVDDGKNSYYSNRMHRALNKEMCELAITAARLGENVTLYGKVMPQAEANKAIGLGLYYREPVWWNKP